MQTGRSISMANSCGAEMYGVQAVGWNPANLGLKGNPGSSLYFPISFSASFINNSFTPQYIADTFVEGDTLFDEDKADIISKMNVDDFKVHARVGVPVFGVSVNAFAFNVDVHAFGRIGLPSDLLEMALTGPVVDEIYDLSDVESEAMAYAAASLTFAKALTSPKFLNELSVGATFKYIYGGAYGLLDKHEGQLQITHETIDAYGMFRYLYSLRGDGVGLDLGASGRIKPVDMYCGLTFGNIVGNINWTEVEAGEFDFSRVSGIHIDSLTDEDYWKNFFSNSDTTYKTGDISSPLPRYFLLSAEKSFLDDKVDVHFSWYQGMNKSPAHSTTPKISFGTELHYLKVLPLRFGIGLGGVEKSEFALGFGLNRPTWQMNFGWAWQQGIALGAKGFSIAITNYFGGQHKRP